MGFGGVFHRLPGVFVGCQMIALIEVRCSSTVGVSGEIVEFRCPLV